MGAKEDHLRRFSVIVVDFYHPDENPGPQALSSSSFANGLWLVLISS